MKFTITQNNLAMLQEKNKLYNYISSSFTKTYFGVGDGKFVVFFRGAKGALKTTIDVSTAVEDFKVFQIDYVKWLNALSKVSFADEIQLNLTEKNFKISIPGSADTISLGVTLYEKDSSEFNTLVSMIDDYLKANKFKHTLDYTEELGDALTLTNSMFSNVGTNNAIALKDDGVVYADRSIVFKAKVPSLKEFCNGAVVELHKYSAGVMLQAVKLGNKKFLFDEVFRTLYWESSDTQILLSSETCDIAIPSDEDVKNIQPGASGFNVEIDHRELYNALEFFNGFYEASVWKPITFNIGTKSFLHYKHPTTEINKELPIVGEPGAFTIGSETLSKLLSRSCDRVPEELSVAFSYDEDSAGVGCKVGDFYDVVFAKLLGV